MVVIRWAFVHICINFHYSCSKATFLAESSDFSILRRFSTAQVGPDNRIWVGSLHPVPMAGLGQGRVYAFSSDGQIERILDLERGAKGLCWSPDGEFMYLTQSESKSILRYEMDSKTNRPKNPRLFVRHKEEGTPNGLAMDAEGCLWAAIYGGWQVARYSPDGELIAKIGLPVPLPTALCFGGERYQDIFVTSCRLHVPPEVLVDAPSSGALFKIPVKYSGLKGRNFRVN